MPDYIPYMIALFICCAQAGFQTNHVFPLSRAMMGIKETKYRSKYTVHQRLTISSAYQVIRAGCLILAMGCINTWAVGIPIMVVGLILIVLGCRMQSILKKRFGRVDHDA